MSTAINEVKEWILAKHAELTDIDPHLDLIENRLIDSLSFVEFVFLVSQLSGVEINVDTIELDDFRTLHNIEKRYF
ncbi:hypothetical protein Lesp02_34260 [Lentzea sp. NBRC 105346]|uniref:acyl carrier protein n=1 Tax=Lentzea sp. NBRC 105346 TaxID=3032205 RepID=UPI0024A161F6|nr:acyl carrier protein [Lentzea sp. NBRC 105346]GLZ31238.1 hypothetical protein Lesp02_34260 [Lentzea sp. NBRC 105346]